MTKHTRVTFIGQQPLNFIRALHVGGFMKSDARILITIYIDNLRVYTLPYREVRFILFNRREAKEAIQH